ncbi:helix-turn-helix transcriptional regulator [Gordonia sp. TBRC 11910]|uniref:Helix-turn-helix transcriptional regulator n=1 Tax=Gordonia asplenii TaxID=2725283 RepID=A0A848KQA2_9ACTN|nr:helix-turn-helix transcriptional regulator [Gordonia asplenii]NMO00866.1 helix-turn-helix transcriptional regulator [Gordonia asplenii]
MTTSTSHELSTETPNDAAARRLRGLLAQDRISASSVATAIGMRQPAMSRRTRGVTEFTINELFAICDWLGYEPMYLLTGQGNARQTESFVSERSSVQS